MAATALVFAFLLDYQLTATKVLTAALSKKKHERFASVSQQNRSISFLMVINS